MPYVDPEPDDRMPPGCGCSWVVLLLAAGAWGVLLLIFYACGIIR